MLLIVTARLENAKAVYAAFDPWFVKCIKPQGSYNAIVFWDADYINSIDPLLELVDKINNAQKSIPKSMQPQRARKPLPDMGGKLA